MKITVIYIEASILEHPRVIEICARFPQAQTIICERYTEVFNPKSQNFRLQKSQPALILAAKHKNFVLPTPETYGIGARKNYYFSHMLNCPYDCRYCFLQGMYQSANYVVFINYADYQQAINDLCNQNPTEAIHFFSGYDSDSLAFEPVTKFVDNFLPFFATLPNAWLELRTKSTQIRSLLKQPVLKRAIIAFSLSPDNIVQELEHGAPNLSKRIEAILKLQQQGWLIGLRFDPLIYHPNYKVQYQQLFMQVFQNLNLELLHSVSLGSFRLPEKYFKKIHKLYPQEPLFSTNLIKQQGMITYPQTIESDMQQYCGELLLTYIPADKFFPCTF